MSDLLNIGVSALLSYRSALDTAGHNIANANTPGYSRQRVELQTRVPTASGSGFSGSGVQVTSTTRTVSSLLTARAVADQSAYSRLETFEGLAARADVLLSGSDTGLSKPLQDFYSAASGVSANPASTASRQALLAAADGLGARFADLQGQLAGMEGEINTRLAQAVSEVNQYAGAIAALNDRIALATGAANGNPPNDLLDQRDQLVQELSARIGVSTVPQDDGSINVFAAGGQALVLGNSAQALGLADDAWHSGRQEIVLAGSGVNVNAQVSGGSIGGLLDARSQLLDPLQNKLGRLAAGVINSVNAVNAQGVDLVGALGGNLFVPVNSTALPAMGNGGNAQVSVGIADAGALAGEDYTLSYNGSGWQLAARNTGTVVPLAGSGTAADPYTGAGLSLVVSGTPAAGDRYLLQPTRNVSVQLATTDPSRIAAASAITTRAATANTGSGSISAGSVLNAGDPALQAGVTIRFTSATTYSINGAGSYTYTPGANLDLNGWRVQLSGTPAVNDEFSVSATGANSGNNRNALQLAGLASSGVLDSGRTSIASASGSLVAQTGGIAQQAALRKDAQAAIQVQTQAERDATSGVNLDEEAADLVRYQQAYQAAARIIAVADTVFQSLLQAARGA